ncbi:helix-turn-helix domain-containing protein [Microbacterium sp. GXS0129]|uniref:helix-turn-helix domain-containing protein n=1 Tax=Microbacterium sp. GXS0129 TaxID=3377836 RepID=UPI00383AE417
MIRGEQAAVASGVRTLRLMAGVTVSEFASMTGRSVEWLIALEAGTLPFVSEKQLANLTGELCNLIRRRHASGGVTGAILGHLREDVGLSLEAAAAAADTTPSYLRKVEAGTFISSRSYVARVTKALVGVPEVAR